MERPALIQALALELSKTGFFVSEPHLIRGQSFDLVARRDDTLLLVKVLTNVDAFSKEAAEELKLVAMTLRGTPLLVGSRSGAGPLENGVLYSRFGVPIVAPDTLREFLEDGVPPFVFSAPGGLYVRLDADLLRELRESGQVTAGKLAEVAGVSRRTVQMYFEGQTATVDVAMRLEDFLGVPLILPVDPFLKPPEKAEMLTSWNLFERFEKEIFRKLQTLGFSVLPTAHSPFEAFAAEPASEALYVTGVGNAGEDVSEKVQIVAEISRVAERDFVIFLERRTAELRRGPFIAREELRRLRVREDLESLIEERK